MRGVELLPITEFDETVVPLKHPGTGEDLCQYWGYQTCALASKRILAQMAGPHGWRMARPRTLSGAYFVPMQRFAAGPESWAAIASKRKSRAEPRLFGSSFDVNSEKISGGVQDSCP